MLGKLTHKHIDTRTLRRHCLKAECWFANELSWWLILPFHWLVKGAIRIQCIDAHQERKTVGLGCLYIMCETVRFKVKHTLEHRRHVTHSLIIIIIIHSDYAFELLHDLKYESTSQCEYMWVTLHAGGFFFFFVTFSSLFFFYRRPALFLISILVHIFFFMAMAHSFSLSLSCFSSPSAGNITQHYATSVQFLIVTFLLSLLRRGSLSIMSVYLICLINFNMVYKV